MICNIEEFAVDAAYRFLQGGRSALSADDISLLTTNIDATSVFQQTIGSDRSL